MAVRGSHSGYAREPTAKLAVLSPRRERLAIVSSRDALCGIAAYTQALEKQLADIFDVTVFELDQYLLRSRHPRVRKLADRHIQEMCHALAGFDAVNLQLEYGTLGRATKDICRRFSWIVEAAPRLSVAFHTLTRPTALPQADYLKAVLTFKWRTASDIYGEYRRNRHLSLRIAGCLQRAQRQKPVCIIVHNRRDRSDAQHLYGFKHVVDHPLAFLSAQDVNATLAAASRRHFPLLDGLPQDATLVGVFGFINDYKGFSTAVRALRHLPDSYHLLIFGGIHPKEIAAGQPIHPHLAALLDTGFVDAALFDRRHPGLPWSETGQRAAPTQPVFTSTIHPHDLSHRIHFMGALAEADFLAGMALCDIAVFPYLEVGQSASGPLSLALELRRRLIASRTHTFLEFAGYHPNTIEFFDIGNHLELAKRIAARPQYAQRPHSQYDIESNKSVYLAANSAPSGAARFGERPKPAAPARRGRTAEG